MALTKMTMRILKLFVALITVLIMITGGVLAALGIWVLVVDYHLVRLSKIQDNGFYTTTLMEPGLLETAAVICIAVGGTIMVTCGIALHGIRKESKCFLAIAVGLFVVLMCMDAVIIILTSLTHQRTEDHMRNALMEGVRFQYDSTTNSTFLFSKYFDRAQVLLECCGVDNYTDFKANSVMWRDRFNLQIPKTCCVMTDKSLYLDEGQYPLATNGCEYGPVNFYQKSCVEPMKKWMDEKSFVLLAVSAFAALVKIIGCILGVVLLCLIKEEAPYNYL